MYNSVMKARLKTDSAESPLMAGRDLHTTGRGQPGSLQPAAVRFRKVPKKNEQLRGNQKEEGIDRGGGGCALEGKLSDAELRKESN